MIKVAAFYEFQTIEDPQALKEALLPYCKDITGTIIMAREGINSTVAGFSQHIDALTQKLQAVFPHMVFKFSYADTMPFFRMKIKIKKEIVTLRQPEADPTVYKAFEIEPKDWNAFVSQDDVIMIDVRNDYECKIGTFKGAINPKTNIFTDFVGFVDNNLKGQEDKKIAVICTGGIRVEKAAAFMMARGFKYVYKLKGGILKYLEEIPPEESLWVGECFVFDQRTSVGQHVAPGTHKTCFGCRMPLSQHDVQQASYTEGVSCPYCSDSLTPERKNRFMARQYQIEIAKKRRQSHVGQQLALHA